MKKQQGILLIFLTAMTTLAGIVVQNYPSRSNSDNTWVEKSKQLRHVVLFSFKESSSPADIKSVEEAFMALPTKIPQIRGFEWGTNNSPEGLDKGYTHCFFLTFDSEEDRAIYLPHPDHKAFGTVLRPHLKEVLVVDYWNK